MSEYKISVLLRNWKFKFISNKHFVCEAKKCIFHLWLCHWHMNYTFVTSLEINVIIYAKNSISSLYSKTCLLRPLNKKTNIDFQHRLTLNAGQKYCRMHQGEHYAILSTFIKLPFVFKTFVIPPTNFVCGGYTVLRCPWVRVRLSVRP